MGKYYFISFTNDLSHYGIPNMHWGQRRFQNEDGSLTPEGKERYNHGKELSRERDSIAKEKRRDILNKDLEYQKAKRNSREASDAYDNAIDAIAKEQAMYRKGKADAEAKRHYDEANERAMNHANDVITKKYGDTALSDIEHYKAESEKKFSKFVGRAMLAVSVAAIGAFVIGASKSRSQISRSRL